ncbi:MAG: TonB-dependent receptor [Steroidobacteraceae bacterium]
MSMAIHDTHRLRLTLALSWITTALAAAPAYSADTSTGDADRNQLEEIVVTAQKREQNVQETPLSITAVTGDALEKIGVTTVQELNRVDPALQIGQATGTVTTFIRGIGNPVTTAGNEASVPVYIDDVYFVRASTTFFDLASVERVEILKGPQGTLFGRNASGGVISIYTKDPNLEEAEADVRLGYANYDTRDAKGYFSVPLGSTVAANLAISYHDQNDGWGKNRELANPLDTSQGYAPGGDDYWNGDSTSVRGKILWQPSESTSIMLIGYYQDSRSTIGFYGRPFSGTVGGTPDSAHNNGAFVDPSVMPVPAQVLPKLGFYDVSLGHAQYDDADGWGTSARLDQELSFAEFVSISAYRTQDELFSAAGNYSPYDWLVYDLNIRDSQFSQEFQLKSKADAPFSWIVGAYYLDAKGGFDPTIIHGPGQAGNGIDGIDIVGKQDAKSYAGFGQMTYPVTDATNVTAGIRYTKDKVKGRGYTDVRFFPGIGALIGLPTDTLRVQQFDSNNNFGGPEGIAIVDGNNSDASPSFEKVTWKLAVDHEFADGVMGYVNYSRGYKAGTFNTLPLDSAALDPEVIDAYELGFKSDLADGRVRLNGAVFWNDIKDPQVQAQRNGLVFLKNAGKARTKGVELDVTALATPGVTVRLGATYLDAKFREFPDAPSYCPSPEVDAVTCQALTPGLPLAAGNLNTIVVDAKGNYMPYASKWKVTSGISYETQLAGLGEMTFDLAGNYSSKFNWDADNVIEEPSRFLMDASVSLTPTQLDSLTLRLWMKNVTDEEWNINYYAQASGSAFSSAPGAPRTYGAEVQWRF